MQYAARAVQLAEELFADGLESQFIERLSLAESNLAQFGDGSSIYQQFVQPAKVDWQRIGGHYAITSLFYNYPQNISTYCYTAERQDYETHSAAKAKLALGRVRLTSRVTRESCKLCFCILHLGDHIITGAVRDNFADQESYQTLKKEIQRRFASADFPEVIRCMDRFFGEPNCSFKSLFKDDQRNVIARILAARVEETEVIYKQIYEDHSAIMRFLTNLQLPLPKVFRSAADITLNTRLREEFQNCPIKGDQIRALLDHAKTEGVALDVPTLEFAFRRNLEQCAERLAAEPTQLARLQELDRALSLLADLPFAVNLWRIQNIYYRLRQSLYRKMERANSHGDESARAWIACFMGLGKKIGVRVTTTLT
jgi:hypothetical protein